MHWEGWAWTELGLQPFNTETIKFATYELFLPLQRNVHQSYLGTLHTDGLCILCLGVGTETGSEIIWETLDHAGSA